MSRIAHEWEGRSRRFEISDADARTRVERREARIGHEHIGPLVGAPLASERTQSRQLSSPASRVHREGARFRLVEQPVTK